MRYHKHLSAERVRALPWKTQIGMIASELSRAHHLNLGGAPSPETAGCLDRARELFGVMESSPSVPKMAFAELTAAMRVLRLPEASEKAGALYEQMMSLYRSAQ